jgi:hypothetical protein
MSPETPDNFDPLTNELSVVQDSSDPRKLPDDWQPVTMAGKLRPNSNRRVRRERDDRFIIAELLDASDLGWQEDTASRWNGPADR